MSLSKLEAAKRNHPKLAKQLDAVWDYLSSQQREGVQDFLPKLAAVKLGLNEAAALGLLMLLEDAGLLAHQYDVLCRNTNALITSVPSLQEVEDGYDCNFCGRDHAADELRVELVFRPAGTPGGNFERAA